MKKFFLAMILVQIPALSFCEETPVSVVTENKGEDQFCVYDNGDGWIYISDVTKEKVLLKFRVKGKPTGFKDLDVVNLSK